MMSSNLAGHTASREAVG